MNIMEYIETEYGCTPGEVQKRLMIGYDSYYAVKTGRRRISRELALKIYSEFNVPFEKIFAKELDERRIL